MVRVHEAVGSTPATRTMRSVLIGSEYPTKDTPHFLLSKLGQRCFCEQQLILDAQELCLVPGEGGNVACSHYQVDPMRGGQTGDRISALYAPRDLQRKKQFVKIVVCRR